MADETKDQPETPASSASGDAADDDVFSLEGLDEIEAAPVVEEEDSPPEEEPEPQPAEDENSAFDHYQTSKDEIDEYLVQADPEFLKSLKDLNKISPEDVVEDIESVELDENLLKKREIGFVSRWLDKMAPILRPYYIAKGLLARLLALMVFPVVRAKGWVQYVLGDGRKVFKEKLVAGLGKIKRPVGSFAAIVKKMSWRGRIVLALSISIFAGVTFLGRRLITGRFLPDPRGQSLERLEDVADLEISLGDVIEKIELEPFDSAIRHPEYVIQLRRVIVNLKRSGRSKQNPMGLFEFYVEGSNQEAAVELKNREVEALDLLQRVIEAYTYKEVSAPKGKQRLKIEIRRELNTMMTRGRVKKVFFKTITLKP